MRIISSYSIKLNGDLKALENSITIYREALSYVIPIVDTHWDEMRDYEFNNQRMGHVERLIHSTKNNQAVYNFDKEFHKFPCYLRRAVINSAIGIVSSYRSNLENWEEKKLELEGTGKKIPQPPRLSNKHYDYPAYYKNNLFRKYLQKVFNRLEKNQINKIKNLNRAILLGDNSHINKKLQEKIRYIGLSHLFAMSGLHIGLVLGIFYYIFKKI